MFGLVKDILNKAFEFSMVGAKGPLHNFKTVLICSNFFINQ